MPPSSWASSRRPPPWRRLPWSAPISIPSRKRRRRWPNLFGTKASGDSAANGLEQRLGADGGRQWHCRSNDVDVVYAGHRDRRQRNGQLRQFAKTLTVQIEDGESRPPTTCIAAINAEGTFTAAARPPRRDQRQSGRHRHRELPQISSMLPTGGSGEALDTASGLDPHQRRRVR